MQNESATYTKIMPCTPVGEKGPECPAGWESVGYTQPGSCWIGNVPGYPSTGAWKMFGYNRVCKRKVPTSGNQAVDCCSDLFGISDSVECKTLGYHPYSWKCNNVMVQKCNGNVQKDPYAPEWNGMPNGSSPIVYSGCNGRFRGPPPSQTPGCVDEFCINYLRNAPPNNFFHDHDYTDYYHHFPRYSYTMPNFAGTWGYQPIKTPYKPYTDQSNKNSNTYCQQFPQDCWNTHPNDYHY